MARLHRSSTFDDMPDSALSWGETLYRSSLMLVGLVLFFALINFLYRASIADPRIPLAPFVIAGAIWLVGLFCRKASRA